MAVDVKSPVSAPAIPAETKYPRVRRVFGRAPSPAPDQPATGLTVTQRTLWIGASIALVLAAIHIAISWGHLPVYWGDSGRWLHEMDRFASGEGAYRDFYWAFPPLAIWVIGGLGRIFGSDLVQIWTITALLCATIAWTWSRFAMRLVGERFALAAVAVVLPLGIAYSTTGSAPLAMGMYTPAAPVGFLCLLLQLVAALSLARRPTQRSAIALGLFGALCILAKHDFWLPAGVLMLGAPSLAGPERRRMYVTAWGTAALALGAGMAYLAAENGFDVFLGILTGFGQVQELGGRGIPSLETLCVEAIAAGLCVTAVAIAVGLTRPDKRRKAVWVASSASAATVILMAVWLAQALWIARFGSTASGDRITDLSQQFSRQQWATMVLLKNAVKLLSDRITVHAIPTLLPFGVFALFLKYRRRAQGLDGSLALLLLVTAMALRVRRGMEFSEWTSILIEIPIYAFVARTLLADRIEEWSAAARVLLVGLVLLVAWQHALNGYGPLSRRGTRVPVETPRGTVRLIADQASHYTRLKQAVDGVDPSGRRPIIAFGYSGSFNYFFDRAPASPLTHGFRLSGIDPNEAVRLVLSADPPVIAIDNPYFDHSVPEANFQLLRWQARTQVNHYLRYDRAYFEHVVANCKPVDRGLRGFTLYDCPRMWRDGEVSAR